MKQFSWNNWEAEIKSCIEKIMRENKGLDMENGIRTKGQNKDDYITGAALRGRDCPLLLHKGSVLKIH